MEVVMVIRRIDIKPISDAQKGDEIMNCPRCRGRMYAEKYYDFVRSFDAWKCTCCGEVLDPTILANRARNSNSLLG